MNYDEALSYFTKLIEQAKAGSNGVGK